MFFSSIKEINRSISRRMSNIYLKVTIEKNWRSQNFDFLSLRNLSPGQFLGSSNSRRYHWILKLIAIWVQNCLWLFYYFNFERNYDVLKSKNPCILWNKNINFNKNQKESKIPHTVLERRTLCFSSYKNRKLKVNQWWVELTKEKRGNFFVLFILSKENFFNILFSLNVQCIEYIFRRYIPLHIKKHYFIHFFACF